MKAAFLLGRFRKRLRVVERQGRWHLEHRAHYMGGGIGYRDDVNSCTVASANYLRYTTMSVFSRDQDVWLVPLRDSRQGYADFSRWWAV